MKKLLIKILNTPITQTLLKDFKKWIINKLIDFLQKVTEKLQEAV